MQRRRKSKIKVPDLSNPDYDVGTPEIHRQEVVEVYGVEKKKRARVLSSPLDYYLAKDAIDKDQHCAGMQFYKLWYHGGGKERFAAMDLMRTPGSNDSEYQSMMRIRYSRALESFQSPVRRFLVVQVVCVGESAGSAMRAALREYVSGARNYKQRMVHLRAGLDDLVKHFARRRG